MSATTLSLIEGKTRPEYFTGLWILFFRHGVQATLQKVFYHAGDLVSAQKRARDHCYAMGYRYIYIRPLVVDIDGEEEYYKKNGKRVEDSSS